MLGAIDLIHWNCVMTAHAMTTTPNCGKNEKEKKSASFQLCFICYNRSIFTFQACSTVQKKMEEDLHFVNKYMRKSLKSLKILFLKERLEQIFIFPSLQEIIYLSDVRNCLSIKEFQFIKGKGANLSWLGHN